MLENVLNKLGLEKFYIHIECGGSFSENCNRGAKNAQTENLIFLNDDTEPVISILEKMAMNESDIIGLAQFIPNHNAVRYGIGIELLGDKYRYELADKIERVKVPSGYCFGIKKSMWDKLGGLSEDFVNGGADVDLFLRAMEKGAKISYIETPMTHYCSHSLGRFDFANLNDKIFEKKWSADRFTKLKFKQNETLNVDNESIMAIGDFYYRTGLIKKGQLFKPEFKDIEILRKKGLIN